MSASELTPFFYLVLSPLPGRTPRGRVVLCHGYNQCHRSWLRTAVILRDRLDLEILLLDFYNHGESPTLTDRRLHSAETFCNQVRCMVLKLGWQDECLTLGGCSMGGSVALHYFTRWPSNVGKLVLVASAGLEEVPWMPSSIAGNLTHSILGPPSAASEQLFLADGDAETTRISHDSLADVPSVSPAAFILARMQVIATTPSYRVPSDIIERLKKARMSVTLMTAGLDFLHTPQLEQWKRIPGIRIFHHPWKDHTKMATGIAGLELWQYPEIWFAASDSKL